MLRDAIALFGAGVASFLAPCVVPLLPAYVAMVAGESKRAVQATLLFVLGFTIVFAGLGVAAGALGSSLTHFRSGLERVGGVVVIVMGLALLDVIHIRERRAILTVPKSFGAARPVVLGIAFGAAWSPCVGPLLGAALVVAASSTNPVKGGTLLGAYALGIGVPFLIASLGLASSDKFNAWLRRIAPPLQRVAGGLLLVLGVLLTTGWYDHLTSYLARFTPSVGGL
ncbi:MAG TPA: cytochrome c biogenesis protein CcdA [Acidimicrobiales bacterium]|nr:cytochrome c biogenesis protein CcdA [Acidimicrobiales bacterium]